MTDDAKPMCRGRRSFGANAGWCMVPARVAGVRIGSSEWCRSRVWLLAAAGIACIMVEAAPALAEEPAAVAITECDRLAASPLDGNRQGPGVPLEKIDAAPAIAACGRASELNPNNPRVVFNLGRANDAGKDEREAARLYKLAADQGYAAAQTALGLWYDNGRGGLAKDEREAARLYKLAADQGFAMAQYNLGVFYEAGRGWLAKDEHEAARLYKLAADQGDAEAQTSLGFFYEDGLGGLAKDEQEAARLFKLAADQGNAQAQTMLGLFYSLGLGGLAKDEREGARLYKLAADQGDARAQKLLGLGPPPAEPAAPAPPLAK